MESNDQIPISPYLPHYRGPYPKIQLERSRRILIRMILEKSNPIMQAIKKKCGITHSIVNGSMSILTPIPRSLPSCPADYTNKNMNNNMRPGRTNSGGNHNDFQSFDQRTESSCSTPTTPSSSNSNDLWIIPTDANDSQLQVPGTSTSAASLTKDDRRNEIGSKGGYNEPQKCEDSAVKDEKVSMYKCDYCDVTQLLYDDIMKHLITEVHYTASTYEGRYEHGQLTAKYIIRAEAAKNAVAKNERFVVVCPSCCSIHDSVRDCCSHAQLAHKLEEGIYSICPVTYKQTVAIYEFTQCQTCGVHCDTVKTLHKHWKAYSHEPYELAHRGDFLVFFCPFCEARSRSFLQTKEHALFHKRAGSVNEKPSAVNVLHIKLPAFRKLELPIKPETKLETQIDNEISNIKHLRRNSRKSGIQKPNKKYFRQRVTALKNMKKAGYI